MSLELRSSEVATIDSLWNTWESTTEFELEASFKQMDYTSFLNVVKYLRSYGFIEEPQAPKLNILVGGGLRFTIVGEGAIQQYCIDNSLKGKLYHVLLKEKRHAADATDIDLNEYDVRIKLRREVPLSNDDPRVLSTLAKWNSLPKAFRFIKRFSFSSTNHKNIQFDASFIRENKKDTRGNYIQSSTFQGANVSKQPVHYEMEVEALKGALKKSFLFGVISVLRGLQHNYVVVRKSVRDQVIALMKTQTQAPPKSGFPGTQPITLHKRNISANPNDTQNNIRFEDYNVTDKADGLRALMVVARDGKIYMVDRNMNVYGTDRRLASSSVDEWAGAVLDGEWITQNADNEPISHYYAFDIFNGRNGEDVSARPFIVRSAEPVVSRLGAMTETVAALNGAEYTVANIQSHNSLSIRMKTFQTSADTPDGIFKEAASVMSRLAATRPYHTDGLIFTPNSASLPKNGGRWEAQLKWKPANMNSVDFLVVTEKDRDSDGRPTHNESINTRFRDDTQQMVRYKTLRLFVGSSVDPAFVDPRDTILNKKPYPPSMERLRGDYRPVEFSPQPVDPMGSICYVAMNAGATDAAGAAPAARPHDLTDDGIYCAETGDPIANRTIVEMVYDPSKPAGWRWIPLRVRWDKTEKFARGDVFGTMNSEGVANDIWLSIHDPVTEKMICTGSLYDEEVAAGTDVDSQSYYRPVALRVPHAPQRDQFKIRGLLDFHNHYIKDGILLSKILSSSTTLFDMSVGQGGDMHKWIRSKVRFVLGCDLALSGLTDNKNGAYSRYLTQLIKARGNPIPKMLFVQADSTQSYADGTAGQTELDKTILRTLWGGRETTASAPPAAVELAGMAGEGFDVLTLMFTLHYFFKDIATLNGFLRNVSESLKVGGYFVGCCFDGDKVVSMLDDIPTGSVKRGTDGSSDIWTITKKYDSSMHTLPSDESGLGKPIDVSFISIGEAKTEYLVSWEYFEKRMNEIGLELLNADELVTLGLQHSSNLFSTSYDMAVASGKTFPMSAPMKTFSFLNRWFMFRRRTTGSMSYAENLATAPVVLERIEPRVSNTITTTVTAPPIASVAEAPFAEAPLDAPIEPAVEEEAIVGDVVPGIKLATGPAYAFYHKSAPKDDLKIKDRQWKRYISTFAPFVFKDVLNPSVTYSSLEAVLGAAKYQNATNKPELGAQIFGTLGNIHQAILEEKRSLTGGTRPLTAEEEATFVEKEGTLYRNAQKLTEIKKTGAKFVSESWASNINSVIDNYLRQRFEGDGHFRDILQAVERQNAKLVYYMAGGGNELSGTLKEDGSIEGMNVYGKALMKLVGLNYE